MYFDDTVFSFMKDVARRAGAVVVEGGRSLTSGDISSKATAADIVTEYDRRAEQFIVSELLAAYPDTGIYGEEFGKNNADAEWCWIIDPIDGTASFVHDQPYYSVSIGLWRNGQPLAGVVYSPRLNELFSGIVSVGAWCNEVPVKVSCCDDIANAMVATGFSCLRAGWNNNNLPLFCKIAPLVREVRRMGSAALDICFVASGRLDAFWELARAPYDYAGAIPVLLGAGGAYSDTAGGGMLPGSAILCTNGKMHPVMLELLSAYKPTRN